MCRLLCRLLTCLGDACPSCVCVLVVCVSRVRSADDDIQHDLDVEEIAIDVWAMRVLVVRLPAKGMRVLVCAFAFSFASSFAPSS